MASLRSTIRPRSLAWCLPWPVLRSWRSTKVEVGPRSWQDGEATVRGARIGASDDAHDRPGLAFLDQLDRDARPSQADDRHLRPIGEAELGTPGLPVPPHVDDRASHPDELPLRARAGRLRERMRGGRGAADDGQLSRRGELRRAVVGARRSRRPDPAADGGCGLVRQETKEDGTRPIFDRHPPTVGIEETGRARDGALDDDLLASVRPRARDAHGFRRCAWAARLSGRSGWIDGDVDGVVPTWRSLRPGSRCDSRRGDRSPSIVARRCLRPTG